MLRLQERRLKSPAPWLFIQAQMTGEFPAQRAINMENVSMWWRHYDTSGSSCDVTDNITADCSGVRSWRRHIVGPLEPLLLTWFNWDYGMD